jgi:hypothetical protein
MSDSRYDRRGPDPRFKDLDQFADRALKEEARANTFLAAVVEAEAMLGPEREADHGP